MLFPLFFIIFFFLLPTKAVSQSIDSDILVYGATPSGIIAALEANQAGQKVIIIEASNHLGGMTSSGLSNADIGNKKTLGGRAREFFREVKKHYKGKYVWKFEAKVAKQIFQNWLKQAEIKVYYNSPLLKINKQLTRISSLKTISGQEFKAKYYIDASYEGDLMAKSGVNYSLGRESTETYNESLAGFRGTSEESRVKKHAFNQPIPAYSKNGALLPRINRLNKTKIGEGDEQIPAYNFRLCLSKSPETFSPLPEPTNYNSLDFEILAQYLQNQPTLSIKRLFSLTPIPGNKYDLNSRGPFSTDFIGGNLSYPEGDYHTRKRVYQEHKDYILAFFYFLKTDSRVPKRIKNSIAQLGLCKDEFKDNDNWPPQLYVRVARRMKGEYVLKEQDLLTQKIFSDPIAIGSRPIELRHVQRIVLNNKTVVNEGHKTTFVRPYPIPYRSIIPKKSECENLLVPVAASASYVAYNSLRMEPVYMMLGQAAGAAAVLAHQERISVQDIEYSKLKSMLLRGNQILTPK